MNQNNRICKVEGHQKYFVQHICTLNECDIPTRWICPECIMKGVHNHKRLDNSHIMNLEQYLNEVMNQYQIVSNYVDQYQQTRSLIFKKILKAFQRIEQNIKNYTNQYQNIENQMIDVIQRYQNCLGNIKENNFQQLDDDKIKQILIINQCKFDLSNSEQLLQQYLDSVQQQLNEIEMIKNQFNEKQKTQNQISKNIVCLKKKHYTIQEIDQNNPPYRYHGSSLQKNEQYMAYGGSDKLLKIYDIKLNEIKKTIKLYNFVYVCQFTQDSSQLYVGLKEGQVLGFNVQDDFNEIFKQSIHSSDVNNIITIQNEYFITCSADKSIIKTDIKSKQQIFKLTGHTNQIIAIDYSDKDDIIVSGSYDRSIKLWNCGAQSIIINKEQSHNNNIIQIQFINNNKNILSLDFDGNLYKWIINLENQELDKLEQFSDKNRIFNFYQVNQNQNLLLICQNYVKILNEQGEEINTIEHSCKNSHPGDCRQLDNLKYIYMRAFNKIILARAQD